MEDEESRTSNSVRNCPSLAKPEPHKIPPLNIAQSCKYEYRQRALGRPSDPETIGDGDQLTDFMDNDSQGHTQDTAHG